MTQCPNCQNELSNDAMFCDQCQHELGIRSLVSQFKAINHLNPESRQLLALLKELPGDRPLSIGKLVFIKIGEEAYYDNRVLTKEEVSEGYEQAYQSQESEMGRPLIVSDASELLEQSFRKWAKTFEQKADDVLTELQRQRGDSFDSQIRNLNERIKGYHLGIEQLKNSLIDSLKESRQEGFSATSESVLESPFVPKNERETSESDIVVPDDLELMPSDFPQDDHCSGSVKEFGWLDFDQEVVLSDKVHVIAFFTDDRSVSDVTMTSMTLLADRFVDGVTFATINLTSNVVLQNRSYALLQRPNATYQPRSSHVVLFVGKLVLWSRSGDVMVSDLQDELQSILSRRQSNNRDSLDQPTEESQSFQIKWFDLALIVAVVVTLVGSAVGLIVIFM